MTKFFYSAVLIAFFTISSNSQTGSGWGLKGGLNYGSTGNFTGTVEDVVSNPDGNLGWHLGLFGKIGDRFFLKPELVYTNLNSDYSSNKLKLHKLDVPVLGGLRIIAPLTAFIGPSFQYILDTDLKNFQLSNIENNFSVGFNIGIGVNLGNLGLDLRYERGFSKNEAAVIGEAIFDSESEIIGLIDTRPEQLIISVSFKLN